MSVDEDDVIYTLMVKGRGMCHMRVLCNYEPDSEHSEHWNIVVQIATSHVRLRHEK